MALTVIFGFISTKAAWLSLSPAEATAAAPAELALGVWWRRLAQGLERPPAAQTPGFPAASPGIYLGHRALPLSTLLYFWLSSFH